MSDVAPAPTDEPQIRVSTLELFFDLVFVFTATQLTNTLVKHLDPVGFGQAMLVLVLIWWMYGGYAWLTNAVEANSSARRTLLLTGMAGFLVLALTIPDVFNGSGWIFGIAYMVVNVVHTTLFLLPAQIRASGLMRWLAPFNLFTAALVLVGGFLPTPARYWVWVAAVVLQVASPYLRRTPSFHAVLAGHFVERHGLVVIVAIGESIVAIGLGFAGVTIDFGAIVVAVLGLTIAYYLWWAYFSGDEEKAHHRLAAATDPVRRARLALQAWGYAHYPMILGIVVLAAGVKKSVGHAFEPLGWAPSLALAGGVALFLLGHAWFLRVLSISGVAHRVVAAVALLAAVPLGRIQAVVLLIAVPLITATALIIEDLPRMRSSGDTSLHTFGRTEANHS